MSYRVLDYSIDNLASCFLEQAQAHDEIILGKQHLSCFEDYFNHIGVQTIVVEENYVNRDFLEDYSSYYVRSFKEYERNCIRLHFFQNSFDQDAFTALVSGVPNGLTIDNLQANYQGFMVLKPLPTTIIGKTCVVTYEHENRRYFPAIRTYKSNLYGIPLTVDSLAYQEQDSIVAACASSSIWTAFHGTAFLFQHSLPSPVEITNWATKYFPFTNRHFPNKGLSGEQMAIAIREVGLEPYLYNVSTYDKLKASVYAYLKGKIPVVLGFNLWDQNDAVPGYYARSFGKHAVAITGFSLGKNASNKFEAIDNLKLTSSRMDKIYAHDDQMGPFARMEFDGSVVGRAISPTDSLNTYWLDRNGVTGRIKASPEILIIPLYHKIRIPFEAILIAINYFNAIFIPLIGKIPNFDLLEWDIFLSDIRDFKKSILDNGDLTPDIKRSIVTSKYPKYLWRAIGYHSEKEKMEFIFDATDIDQGSSFLNKIVYDEKVERQYQIILAKYKSTEMENLSTKEMIESFQ